MHTLTLASPFQFEDYNEREVPPPMDLFNTVGFDRVV